MNGLPSRKQRLISIFGLTVFSATTGWAAGPGLFTFTQKGGAFDLATPANWDKALKSGKCPDVYESAAASFSAALKTDMSEVNAASVDCEKRGHPFQFQGQLANLKNEPQLGPANVSCNSQGELIIQHRNGATSIVKFAGPDRLASVTTKTDSDSGKLQFEYRASEPSGKEPWQVITTLKGIRSEPSLAETFESFNSRVQCLDGHCANSDLVQNFQTIDEKTTPKNPFGAFGTASTAQLAASHIMTKKILNSTFMSERSFEKTCQALGAIVPQDIAFSGLDEGNRRLPASDPSPGSDQAQGPSLGESMAARH